MDATILLKNMRIEGAEAQQNMFVAGIPAPTAFVGYSRNLARQLGVEHVGTAIVIHDFEMQEGHSKFVPHKNKMAASTQELFKSSLQCSLYIRLRGVPVEFDIDELVDMLGDRKLCRLAGGNILGIPWLTGSEIFVSKKMLGAEVFYFENDDEAIESFRKIGPGSLLIDRNDIIQNRPEGTDPLDAIVTALELVKKENEDEDEEIKYKRMQKGWIVPLHAGFLAIEQPTIRPNMLRREGEIIPHAFAECLTSLGEFISVRKVKKDNIPACFWYQKYDTASNIYYVSA